MKKSILLLALLIGIQLSGHSATHVSDVVQREIQAPIFGAGQYNKQKIQRQNTPKKINKRNRRSLRKMNMAGVFYLDRKEASNV